MTRHILLVDDDQLMRRSLALILEQAGYHNSTVANAEDALAAARVDHPDLVLLNIGLPGMDGLEVVQIFRKQLRIPVIFLTARRRNLDEIWIMVGDSGPGISHSELDKIFTPFYRSNQEKRIAEGMGLGLSIAQELVQAHGGSLDVESQPGEGSKYFIRLPLISSDIQTD